MTIEHTDVVTAVGELSDAVLRFQWGTSLAAVVALTVLAALAGWWLSGRVRRPLQRITATARRPSLSNLDERVGLVGPPDELKELADTFDAMVERLRRSADSQRRIVANAAHELRTPLATQRALIQIGLEDPTPERVARTRADLLEVNRRTERLINGLLVLASAEHGLENPEPVALDRVVEQTVAETSPEDVTVTVHTVPVTVTGDPVLLHHLVANLLDNALRYNRPGGTVHIDLTRTGPTTSDPSRPDPTWSEPTGTDRSGAATLTVRNSGPVVPAERVDELFRPFSRLPHGRDRRRDGAGLGLSIVAALARAHGAELSAPAESGRRPGGDRTLPGRVTAGSRVRRGRPAGRRSGGSSRRCRSPPCCTTDDCGCGSRRGRGSGTCRTP